MRDYSLFLAKKHNVPENIQPSNRLTGSFLHEKSEQVKTKCICYQ